MPESALEKIYVILGQEEDQGQLERLRLTLSGLLSHVNLTSNLYLVGGNLSEGMPQVERIQKAVTQFLKENLFVRAYVHFVHSISPTSRKDIDFCYQYYYQGCKRVTHEFDMEAFLHQEVPRLMFLPVIVPDADVESSLLGELLDVLKGAFLLPSLYLDRGTFSLASNGDLLAKAEKLYYGQGNGGERSEIVCSLCHEDILHDTLAKLEAEAMFMRRPCPAALIISAPDGMVYPCVDAFVRKESIANIYEGLNVDTLMAQYGERRDSARGCLDCREKAAVTFSELPLPKGAIHEVGDLLFRFGILHQEAENHLQAVERFEKSLKLSSAEEMGPVQFRLGLSYTGIGRYEQALEAFHSAELTYRDQYYFHFYTGLCYFEKGDYGAALERFSEALRLEPPQDDLIRILIYVGTCYNSLGDYEKASVHLEKAKNAGGSVKEIYNALGFSYFQLKDYDQAIENLSRAVELDPHSAIDYASLGASYREKGDTSKAIAMYEKALALDPAMISARENLERLKGTP